MEEVVAMNYIEKYRKEKGYTLEKLASLSNLSVGYLCHLEKGNRQNPSFKTMKSISTALNKTIEEIFC